MGSSADRPGKQAYSLSKFIQDSKGSFFQFLIGPVIGDVWRYKI